MTHVLRSRLLLFVTVSMQRYVLEQKEESTKRDLSRRSSRIMHSCLHRKDANDLLN